MEVCDDSLLRPMQPLSTSTIGTPTEDALSVQQQTFTLVTCGRVLTTNAGDSHHHDETTR
jgi:hypothetical protein